MSEDRWRQTERIYQDALKITPEKRANFLEEACRNVPDLKRDVEVLLAADSLTFMNRPAWDAVSAIAEDLLPKGESIGIYRIDTLLGRGGMGEVYRAHDAKLNRDVAVKVLPAAFVNDRERLSRFQREARMLASLNHPNIASIYGLEESGGVRALVMELVEGPTLAERIAAGAIPLNEALPIARQVADAVEYAHEQNVIHRDLKPANIKVKEDGTVKVLDFGLAKAIADEAAEVDISNSPTLSMAATRQGVILGTAAYMSPEQARGKRVDRRTDIWAFGVVLYEMLTGRQTFGDEDVSMTLSKVLQREPDFDALPPDTPANVRQLLKLCLRKDARQRVGDFRDVRLAMEGAFETAVAQPAASASASTGRSTLIGRVAWAAAAVFCISTAALSLWVVSLRRPPAEPQAIRFSVGPPEGAAFTTNPQLPVISPDGSKLAFPARPSPSKPLQLWIRALDSETAQPLVGTENVNQPFWSADSRFLAFYADGKLKKIAVSGGPAQPLAESTLVSQGTWSRDGVVLFPTANTIYRVSSAGGGKATQVTMLDSSRQELLHQWPYFLPDGKHFLFLARSSNPENNAIYAASLDSPQRKLLVNVLSNPVYAPPGYLLFNRDGTLMAQPFDAQRLELAGDEVPIAENVDFNPVNGRTAFSASENGVLGYRTGAGSQLTWFDRSGKPLGVLGDPTRYFGVQLSPKGKQASVSIVDPTKRNSDIWIFDLASGLKTHFTFDPSDELAMVWTHDGKRAVFNSQRKAHFDLYQKNADGTGTEELLFEDNLNKYPISFTPDGKFLLYASNGGPTGNDLFILSLADKKSVPFLNTSFSETPGGFSHDGRWIAYISNESGRPELYVAPFPGPGGKRQVSTVGATTGNARWSHDDSEIFYIAPDDSLMAAAVNGKATSFKVGAVKQLFQARRAASRMQNDMQYDVSPDGQRFLINAASEQTSSAPIRVIVNWTAVLKK